MNTKKRSGRPKKAEHEKVTYQRIAVYSQDYEKLLVAIDKRRELNPKLQLTDAFTEMVAKYVKNS